MSLTPEQDAQIVSLARGMAMDAPLAANSGHQGTAMALAPLAHVLFSRIMRHDPADPTWPDRDRFVLSNGHSSILQYTMLFLSGYGLELDDLRQFRQWGSQTPGHPEAGHTCGIEVTTGPLGQGFANSVGMAIAERSLRMRFGEDAQDHYTFVIAGDGCMMEGISHEAASLAGHLGLGRLICVFDDNHITIDGATDLSTNDDIVERFRAYNWDVVELGEVADDLDALEAAAARGQGRDRAAVVARVAHPHRPAVARFRGRPCRPRQPVQGRRRQPHQGGHGHPRRAVLGARRARRGNSCQRRRAGRRGPVGLAATFGDGDLVARMDGRLGRHRARRLGRGAPSLRAGRVRRHPQGDPEGTRPTYDNLPGLVSGSADLSGSNGTVLDRATPLSRSDPGGRYVHFGIREHAMAASMVGMAKHGGILPIGGTFFVFSDYMKPSIRLAALSKAKVCFVFTHDSVGVGEDGPTHQPIEHLAALRAIPGLHVIRPADGNETIHAWADVVRHDGPSALILSRQNIEVTTDGSAVERGAGIVVDAEPTETSSSSVPAARSPCASRAARAARRCRGRRPCREPAELGRFVEQGEAFHATNAAAGSPGAVGRGGEHVRLGDVGRRIDRDRPIRRERAG